jgi:hypothetical protein
VEVKKLKKKKSKHISPGTKSNHCPYCGNSIEFRSADGIYKENKAGTMLYVCSRYPVCDAYVRILPGTKIPIGSMANGSLRALRNEAHRHFDRLHINGIMSRKQAYEWLAHMIQAPLSKTHIGHMGEYYCSQVIDESKRLLENQHKTH